MRLKRVRLYGFKTFADRTEFSLEGGVVAVVGPNGCGKSNLVDAILWGLGEGSARQLRAQTGQDVIFSGAKSRKPVGYAEVTLIFDNEDRALPIDASEVSVTRRLTRGGDGEYRINGQACRLRDVHDLLADSGLGRAGYAIVGQKEIDAALSASAEDRRAWVDEAAGVQRYRARKVEALRRLSTAQEHLQRVADVIRELEEQAGPLRAEAETARRFRELQTQLRAVEVGLLVHEAADGKREMEEFEAKIAEAQRIAEAEAIRAAALEAEVRRTGDQVSEIELEMDAVRGLQQGSLTALERAEADLRLSAERERSLDALEATLASEGEAAGARIEEAEADAKHAKEVHAFDEKAWTDLRASLAGVGEEARALTEALVEAERHLAKTREMESRRVREEAARGQREARRFAIRRELQGIAATLPDLENGLTEAENAVDAARDALEAAQASPKSIEATLTEIRAEEERDARSVRQAMAEKATLEGRRRGIEATIDAHEGLTQGSRAVLEAAERGILSASYVAVGEAIEADRDLALAIETALGGSANDLIVERDGDAKAAIAWLKERRAGRCTFQPIPLMRPSEPTYELRRLLGEAGVIGRASELVSSAPAHRPVIDSLLGRVVIVEDLDVALRHARTTGWSRMVTVEGEVVHSGGAVTGGQNARGGYGSVQRRADLTALSDEIERLDRAVREYDSRSAKRNQRAEAERTKLAEVQKLARNAAAEMEDARAFARSIGEEKRLAERERERLERELASHDEDESATEAVDLAGAERRRDEALRALAAKSADAEQAESRLREAEERVAQSQARYLAAERRLSAAKAGEEERARRLASLAPERDQAKAAGLKAAEVREKARADRADADARLASLAEARKERLEASLRLTEEAKHARDNAVGVADGIHKAELGRARADSRRAAALQRLAEEYGMDEEQAEAQQGTFDLPDDALSLVNRFRRDLRAMGDVNLGAIEAFERLDVRLQELTAQQEDVLSGIAGVEASIRELDKLTRDKFADTFARVRDEFSAMFLQLFGGGEGALSLTDPERILESGIEISVTLPGKRRQPLNLLSGGERSLCTVALLFALLRVRPSPLVILDEVDAPLDGRNVERFATTLKDFTDNTQFIVITHNPTTIEQAPIWLGVTMQDGVSMLLPTRVPEQQAA
jgi:chromosome segregation protein